MEVVVLPIQYYQIENSADGNSRKKLNHDKNVSIIKRSLENEPLTQPPFVGYL